MENNKYYVPEIEEFRVGFECEYFNSFAKNFLQIEIDESNYYTNSNDGGSWDEDYIFASENRFRVKYLSTQDIEELGFKEVAPASEYVRCFERGNFTIMWQGKTKIHGDGGVVIEDGVVDLFRGTILNKSELKWILARIGVL